MDFSKVIKDRFACKKFSDKKIEDEKLSAVLEAGRLAPTAKNLQEQMIYVIKTDTSLAKVDKITPCRYGAPIVLAVAYNKDNVFTYPGGKRDSGAEDATIVATHLMLAAKNEGLESCWVNFFNPDDAGKELGIPENEEILMLLDLGYPADGAKALENHFSRKDISETTKYI